MNEGFSSRLLEQVISLPPTVPIEYLFSLVTLEWGQDFGMTEKRVGYLTLLLTVKEESGNLLNPRSISVLRFKADMSAETDVYLI